MTNSSQAQSGQMPFSHFVASNVSETSDSGITLDSEGLTATQLHYANLALVAVAAVTAASEKIATMRADIKDLQAHTSVKSAKEDPVTIVDQEAEALIRTLLADRRPGDGVVGEEGTQIASDTGITWIIDPIDGTVNFIYGIPQYAVSVAAAVDGVLVAGAVMNVATNVVWWAAMGVGSYRLDATGLRRLAASQESSLGLSLVTTGFSYSSERRKAQAESLVRVIPHVRDIRRQGSAALDLCAVADGTVEAYYEHGINAWDFAAGAVIAKEAGATVVTPHLSESGTTGRMCFAAAPRISTEFSALMATLPEALP